jgi:hypothetical protein
MRPEDKAQAEIFELLEWLAPSVVAFAIPNASRRTTSGKASNAVPGLRKGVWDIGMILPIDCRYPGMTAYCEVKALPNTPDPTRRDALVWVASYLSEDQREFGGILRSRGIPHFVAIAPNHLDQVRHVLALWRVQTREAYQL